MKANVSASRSPLLFFILVFALSIPLWLAGSAVGLELLPGVPLSSVVVTFCPAIAAAILVYRSEKAAGVVLLLKRAFDFKRIRSKIWYVPAVLWMPAVMVVEYWLLRWTGSPISAARFPLWMPVAMFAAFFVWGLGEELGWMGYAIDPMQQRLNALPASIVLGLAWAAWHIIPVIQVGRSAEWIAWQCLFWVATRVVMVWVYNNAGRSVSAAAVFHSMLNVSTYLFPVGGSFYDPRISGLIVAAVALIVTVLWGPKTLARYRFARLDGMRSVVR